MKTIKMILVAVTLTLSQLALAHGDHISMGMKEAIITARVYADQLVAEKKISETWKDSSVAPLETKETTINGKKRWVVVLKNEKEKDLSKSKLEVLMTPAGRVVEHSLKSGEAK